MRRTRFSRADEAAVLVESRRRCALCFGLDGDTTVQEGQLAHIDRNRANAVRENAAFLCTRHHSRYDSQSKQTKGFSPLELQIYQRKLYEYLAEPSSWPDAGLPRHRPNRKDHAGKGVSLDVYNLRLPIYRTTVQFIRRVVKDLKPELQEVLKFASDTEDALFLFDESVAEYLTQLFRRALRLNTVEFMRTGQSLPDDFPSLVKEETAIAVWFTEQFDETRTRFAPFLRLA